MLETYVKYIEFIENTMLKRYFEDQKEYLHCKEGCSHCCETGEFPYSKLEFAYLMEGYKQLSKQEKQLIQAKIKKIKTDKENSSDKTFMHECPFLINKRCCVYNNRGFICRTHGLLFYIKDKEGNIKNKMPNCVHLGLNYSNIYDKEKKYLSAELLEKSGIKTEPVAYNIGLKALMEENDTAKEIGLEFGEKKALIDWL